MKNFNQFKSEKSKELYEHYLQMCDKRWPIESKEYYITTSFGATFIRESGEGPSLVLLPGTGGGGIMYDTVIEKLSKSYKVFVVDIIGDFGRSYLSKKLLAKEEYITWQKELYDQLDLSEQFSIAGVSMGAWLGALFATESSRVNKLVMISPVSVVASLSTKSALYGIVPMFFPFTHQYFMKKYFKDFLSQVECSNELFKTEIFGPIRMAKRCFKPIAPQIPVQFSPEQADQMRCETLYIVGKNEVLYDVKAGVEYFNAHFKGTSITVPNTGHDLMCIKPAFICEQILEYLN